MHPHTLQSNTAKACVQAILNSFQVEQVCSSIMISSKSGFHIAVPCMICTYIVTNTTGVSCSFMISSKIGFHISGPSMISRLGPYRPNKSQSVAQTVFKKPFHWGFKKLFCFLGENLKFFLHVHFDSSTEASWGTERNAKTTSLCQVPLLKKSRKTPK